MALPEDPVSGGYEIGNPGFEDWWTCPACYADHKGSSLGGKVIDCTCGAVLVLDIDQQPVCRARCIDPDERDIYE